MNEQIRGEGRINGNRKAFEDVFEYLKQLALKNGPIVVPPLSKIPEMTVLAMDLNKRIYASERLSYEFATDHRATEALLKMPVLMPEKRSEPVRVTVWKKRNSEGPALSFEFSLPESLTGENHG